MYLQVHVDRKDSYSGQMLARLKQLRLQDEDFRFACEFGSPMINKDLLSARTYCTQRSSCYCY